MQRIGLDGGRLFTVGDTLIEQPKGKEEDGVSGLCRFDIPETFASN